MHDSLRSPTRHEDSEKVELFTGRTGPIMFIRAQEIWASNKCLKIVGGPSIILYIYCRYIVCEESWTRQELKFESGKVLTDRARVRRQNRICVLEIKKIKALEKKVIVFFL